LEFLFRSLLVEETPVPKAIRVHKVPLAHKVLREYRGALESKAQPVLKDHRVHKVPQVTKAIRATRVMRRRPMSEPSKRMVQ
jgi:hypothetical protein